MTSIIWYIYNEALKKEHEIAGKNEEKRTGSTGTYQKYWKESRLV